MIKIVKMVDFSEFMVAPILTPNNLLNNITFYTFVELVWSQCVEVYCTRRKRTEQSIKFKEICVRSFKKLYCHGLVIVWF